MRAVVQRVRRAAVRVAGRTVGEIQAGLLVLLGIGKEDTPADADWMIQKLLGLRIFPDEAGKMNRSVTDIRGGLLVVSQFTLYGDVRKGYRPSFSDAMPPADAERFYAEFLVSLRAATTLPVAEGRFAAMMEVELVNDGPVTIVLDSGERASSPSNPSITTDGQDARPTPAFVPFDPSASMAKSRRHLPHWEQPGRTYFVTFRLADSLPQDKLRQWEAERDRWLQQHRPPLTHQQQEEFDRLFPERLERWLDAGHGDCCLRQPEVAAMVAAALRHFDGNRYVLGRYVIMPNHVHVLVTPLADQTVPRILHSWKSYTATEINRRLGRTGALWQQEYFDHLVRNERALAHFEDYIRQNPIHASLKEGDYVLG